MGEPELRELADDIRENGLKTPIWMHDGKLIDGRNRLKACRIAAIEPDIREWSGHGSLIKFVLSLNLKRRHLTQSQRAAIAVELKRRLSQEIKDEREQEVTAHKRSQLANLPTANADALVSKRNAREEAAESAGVSPRMIGYAEQVLAKSPEALEQVKRGEKTLEEAKRELGIVKPKPEPIGPVGQCRINGVLVDDPPDIARKHRQGKIAANIMPRLMTQRTRQSWPTSQRTTRKNARSTTRSPTTSMTPAG